MGKHPAEQFSLVANVCLVYCDVSEGSRTQSDVNSAELQLSTYVKTFNISLLFDFTAPFPHTTDQTR